MKEVVFCPLQLLENMANNYKNWKQFFDNANIGENYKRSYKKYVWKLLQYDLPIIFEATHLSLLLGISKYELGRMSASAPNFYMSYRVPKRHGGERLISVPYPSLLFIQRWINCHILEKQKVSEYAHGFVKGRSIITNASIHAGAKSLLKMDIKDFFPSVSNQMVFRIFMKMGYAPNVSNILTNLCTLNRSIPQGAATSPIISNIVASSFDHKIGLLAKKYSLNYSRYADDLFFSGDHISLNFSNIVEKIIEQNSFKINQEKTLLVRGKGKKIVTGISVAGSQLMIPREGKRNIRKRVHDIICAHNDGRLIAEIDTPFEIESLIGKASFWKRVEPSNPFVNKSLPILKEIAKTSLYK